MKSLEKPVSAKTKRIVLIGIFFAVAIVFILCRKRPAASGAARNKAGAFKHSGYVFAFLPEKTRRAGAGCAEIAVCTDYKGSCRLVVELMRRSALYFRNDMDNGIV